MEPNLTKDEIESVYIISNGRTKKADKFEIKGEKSYSHLDVFYLIFDKSKKSEISDWEKAASKIRVETESGSFFDFSNIIPSSSYEKNDYYSEIIYVSTI